MVYNDKMTQLINKLIKATKGGRLEWSSWFIDFEVYNRILKTSIIFKEKNEFSLNEHKSFFARFENGYIHILRYGSLDGKYYSIAVQSNKQSSIVELNKKDDFQPELMELAFLIEGQVGNYLEYVDLIISKL